MAYGDQASDFPVVADSAVGRILQIDLLAFRIRIVNWVKAKRSDGTFSATVLPTKNSATLSNLLNTASAPELDAAQEDSTLQIFLSKALYPDLSLVGLGLEFFRNEIP